MEVESLVRANFMESVLVGSDLGASNLVDQDKGLEGNTLGAYRLILPPN